MTKLTSGDIGRGLKIGCAEATMVSLNYDNGETAWLPDAPPEPNFFVIMYKSTGKCYKVPASWAEKIEWL